MTGFLVVNAYLKGEKFDVLHSHLISSAEKQGIELLLKTNEEMQFCADKPDFVLFWDKDVSLASLLESRGLPVFNSARSIALCDDKAKTYAALYNAVPQPETYFSPLAFYDADYTEFVRNASARLGYPLVFKECCGSFGEQVYLCDNESETFTHINGKPFLLQKFVKSSSGEDVRIQVVGDRCAAAMKRINTDDFRSNLTNGGTAVPCEVSDEKKSLAVKACKALGLTFGGVDILNDGTVCEVNSNAHIINIMNITGIDIAPLIFEEILKKL